MIIYWRSGYIWKCFTDDRWMLTANWESNQWQLNITDQILCALCFPSLLAHFLSAPLSLFPLPSLLFWEILLNCLRARCVDQNVLELREACLCLLIHIHSHSLPLPLPCWIFKTELPQVALAVLKLSVSQAGFKLIAWLPRHVPPLLGYFFSFEKLKWVGWIMEGKILN